jgi:hypothetical protein
MGPTLSRIRRDHDDTSTAAILCKIAQLAKALGPHSGSRPDPGFDCPTKVSNSDQLFP